MQLSKHLALAEVTRSESAKRNGISNQPTAEHLVSFKKLADKVFEPIREHFGVPIHISSGYRSKELNDIIGGSLSSQHCKGEAIDIDMDGSSNGVTNKMVFEFIKENIEFDQLINEDNYSWVHVSYSSSGKQRKQILDAVKQGKTMKYYPHK
jgi:zinc D-Ala-D-Ala carboxypeptidase